MSHKKQITPFSFSEITGDTVLQDIKTANFISFDNTRVSYYEFSTDKPVANLIFLHGGGAHSKMGYFSLAEKIKNDFSINTYLMDIRGHGSSSGNRGDCPSVESVYKDISQLIKLVRNYNNLPVYLGGHSSGGGLVLNYHSWNHSYKLDGYFFIFPEFGYKSKTAKINRIPFARVNLGAFILNNMSMGLFNQHKYAVSFNYPDEIVKSHPLLVKSITVNMANALTPSNPFEQFQNINESIGLIIGRNDEMFDVDKVMNYAKLVENKNIIAKIIENQNHLSILQVAGFEIGNAIIEWLK